MRCTTCGAEIPPAVACAVCGPSIDSRYAAPASALGQEAPGDGGLAPWEMKRWRVSGLSWAALLLACFVPPVGLVLSFFAMGASKRFRKRPGNRAVAISSLGAAIYMGLIWAYVAFTVGMVASLGGVDDFTPSPAVEGDPATDPAAPAEAQPEDLAELQRLLDQINTQPPPAP